MTKTRYLTEPTEFFELITNPEFIVKYIDFPHDEMAEVKYVQENYFFGHTTKYERSTGRLHNVLTLG